MQIRRLKKGGKKIKKKAKEIIRLAKKNPEETLFLTLVFLSLVFVAVLFGSVSRDVSQVFYSESGKDAKARLTGEVKKMVANYPIESMVPYIAEQNEKTAAYLVAIAKKESDWGKYSPKKRGKDCYNYWGFKGTYNRNAAGYSCFDSPAQAVNVVGRRISYLIAHNVDTPREMVLWKCGSACTARSSSDAAKWVNDVNMYYKKVYN